MKKKTKKAAAAKKSKSVKIKKTTRIEKLEAVVTALNLRVLTLEGVVHNLTSWPTPASPPPQPYTEWPIYYGLRPAGG